MMKIMMFNLVKFHTCPNSKPSISDSVIIFHVLWMIGNVIEGVQVLTTAKICFSYSISICVFPNSRGGTLSAPVTKTKISSSLRVRDLTELLLSE